MRTLLRHTRIQLQKNLLVSRRHAILTLMQVVIFSLFICMLRGLQELGATRMLQEDVHPAAVDVTSVGRCSTGAGMPACRTLLYSPPNHPEVNRIMERVRATQGVDVTAMPPRNWPRWIAAHPNETLAVVEFPIGALGTAAQQRTGRLPDEVFYRLHYNRSAGWSRASRVYTPFYPLDISRELQRAMDEAIFTVRGRVRFGPHWVANLVVHSRPMPVIADARVVDVLSESLFLAFGVLFFYCGSVFNYFVLLLSMVREKEQHLRSAMLMIGLSRNSLWLSWLIWAVVINTASCCCCMATGYAMGFNYFQSSDPTLVFFMFWLFGMAMTAFSFCASTATKNERIAVVLGFMIFIVGTFFQLVVAAGTVYFYDPEVSPVYRWMLYHYPPFNFAKIFLDIGLRIGTKSFLGAGVDYHYSWAELYAGAYPTIDNYYYLVGNFFEYCALAWYLDYVLSTDQGVPKRWGFIFEKSFWGYGEEARAHKEALLRARAINQTSDAELEMRDFDGGSVDGRVAVEIEGLEKTFPAGFVDKLMGDTQDVHAVRGTSMRIKHGSLFCLLGPNGAGKTTTINILTGKYQQTGGTAKIFGMDVATQTEAIREVIGVCPQHDILWPELTAREHLTMFADIKGYSQAEIPRVVQEKLEEVLLSLVADMPAGTYSGGMRRRLSIGISTIGNPKLIFMDEPSTGTDPGNRRMIWNLVLNVKKRSTVILTTHSMEEADLLSDEMVVMMDGLVEARGNALSLKNEYGIGFRLVLTPTPGYEAEAEQMPSPFFSQFDRQAQSTGTSHTYMLPKGPQVSRQIVAFFEELERLQEAGTCPFCEWTVQHSSLEEVFVTIVKKSKATRGSKSGYGVSAGDTGGAAAVPSDDNLQAQLSIDQPPSDAASTRVSLWDRLTGSPAATAQCKALIKKNWAYQKRQRATNICQFLVPTALLVFVVYMQWAVDDSWKVKTRKLVVEMCTKDIGTFGSIEESKHCPKYVDAEHLVSEVAAQLGVGTDAGNVSFAGNPQLDSSTAALAGLLQRTQFGTQLDAVINSVDASQINVVALVDSILPTDGTIPAATVLSAIGDQNIQIDVGRLFGLNLSAPLDEYVQRFGGGVTFQVNVATLLGRQDLKYPLSQITASLGNSSAIATNRVRVAAALGLSPLQLALLEASGFNSTGNILSLRGNSSAVVDVGKLAGLRDGKFVAITPTVLESALGGRSESLGAFLRSTGIIAPNATRILLNSSNLNITASSVQGNINVTQLVNSLIPVILGMNGTNIQISRFVDTNVVVATLIEQAILNFYSITNSPPLSPALMFTTAPAKMFIMDLTSTVNTPQGWLDQIDLEIYASKKKVLDLAASEKYNYRMNTAEYLESATRYLTELPMAGLIFDGANNVTSGQFNYTVQVDTAQSFLSWWLPVQNFYGVDPRNVLFNLVDSSIAYAIDNSTRIDTQLQSMPYIYKTNKPLNVEDSLSYILFPFALTFLLPVFTSMIVYEKEQRLRELMKMMGMRMSAYWAVNYVYCYCLYTGVMIMFTLTAFACNIRLFAGTDFGILAILLFLWGHSMVALSFLLSTFMSRTLISNLTGYLVVVGSVLSALMFNATVYNREPPPLWFMMYSPYAFYRALYIMVLSCRYSGCVHWDNIGISVQSWTPDTFSNYELVQVWLYLAGDTVLYLVLTVYFDKVVPGKFGVPASPLYPLHDLMGWLRKGEGVRQKDDPEPDRAAEASKGNRATNESDDSYAQRRQLLSGDDSTNWAVEMRGLRKVYATNALGAPVPNAKAALEELYLGIETNQCLGLLGPNGAGKTTMISILTGLFRPTSGSAAVIGHDIATEMEQIHKTIGICPQFRVLWDTLTCREHLLFFLRMKGADPGAEEAVVKRTLEEVGLGGDAGDRLSKNLSGGMQRRLQLAIALVGDPEFLVMDEPTTGLDPETRLELWKTLARLKRNRTLLLCTHSMEEAETLCDKIAILSRGKLKCLGTPFELKARYCPHFKLGVNLCAGSTPLHIQKLLPHSQIESQYEAFASLTIDGARLKLSSVFSALEAEVAAGRVSAWTLERMDLENVRGKASIVCIRTPLYCLPACPDTLYLRSQVFLAVAEDEIESC